MERIKAISFAISLTLCRSAVTDLSNLVARSIARFKEFIDLTIDNSDQKVYGYGKEMTVKIISQINGALIDKVSVTVILMTFCPFWLSESTNSHHFIKQGQICADVVRLKCLLDETSFSDWKEDQVS